MADYEELKKKLAEFAATLNQGDKPVHVPGGNPPIPKKVPKKKPAAAPVLVQEKPEPEPVPEQKPVAAEEVDCYTHWFINMVKVLPAGAIGQHKAKEGILGLFMAIGECPAEGEEIPV